MVLFRDRRLAEKKIRKAKSDRHRLVSLMKVCNPAGVLGVDSTANINSEVYGEVSEHRDATTGYVDPVN